MIFINKWQKKGLQFSSQGGNHGMLLTNFTEQLLQTCNLREVAVGIDPTSEALAREASSGASWVRKCGDLPIREFW